MPQNVKVKAVTKTHSESVKKKNKKMKELESFQSFFFFHILLYVTIKKKIKKITYYHCMMLPPCFTVEVVLVR